MLKFVFGKTARYPGFEVEHYQMRRKIRSASINLKYGGLGYTILGTLAQICHKLKLPVFQEYRFYKRINVPDWLDVGGIHEQSELDLPEASRESATRYEATEEYEFRYVLERLPIDFEDYKFLDYGSGKGIVLSFAADYPFRRVTGVELSPMLHQVAEKNIEEMHRHQRVNSGPVYSELSNAAEYQMPERPHVIYLFNPFGPDVLEDVLNRLALHLSDVEQPSYLLYNNPIHHQVIEKHGLFRKTASRMGGKWFVYSTK